MHEIQSDDVPWAVRAALILLAAAPLCPMEASEPAPLAPPKTGSAAAEFSKSARPFLDKYCADCHGVKVQKSDVSFASYTDPASLIKDRTLWKDAMNMVVSGEMPPEKKPPDPKARPLQNEIQAFTHAISVAFEESDRNTKPDSGTVLMHRLTRNEYNNTIRDLFGLDINPAEDFPADEVGHGFDNISDVQWITATHMERYLNAAEMVAMRAIEVTPGKPPYDHKEGKYLEPAGKEVPQGKFRPLNNDKPDAPMFTGPFHSPVKFTPDGEYKLKVKLYALPAGDKPVKIALLAAGKDVNKPASDSEAATIFGAAKNLRPFQILHTAEVKARTEKEAQVIEIKLPFGTHMQRMAVGLIKPPDGAPIPKLFVEWMALEGPMDTRPPFQRKYFSSVPEGSKEKFVRDFLTGFLLKAFRRPPTTAEVDRYLKLANLNDPKQPWLAGVQKSIQVILSSPKFLFRPETEGSVAGKPNQVLNDYELASRLSYFLWSSMPDAELFALCEKKQLNANLDAQIKRMLKDEKSKALTENFALQWLQLRRLAGVTPDPKVFPFASRLKPAMLEETTLFIDAIFREDHSILDLLDAKFTFLNESLGKLYRITDTHGTRAGQKPLKPGGEPLLGNNFRRVELADTERGGLLTQASILMVTSNPTRTSPVRRGKWVLDQLLATPPPPPPPNVPELDGNKVLTGTLRQRLEQHRANVSCANCHARMDPIGFAFENYDAIGGYREKDGNDPIDASGTLTDGQSFKGAAGLKEVLKKKRDLFTRCLTEKMFTYALGRGVEVYDSGTIDGIVAGLAKADFHVSALVSEIVKSEPFRMRRAKE